jgi:carbon monoxide dehydrogenase subunit G
VVAHYYFLTTWIIDAPIERVFEAIHDYERWPEWWPGVQTAHQIEPGDANGIGSVARHAWRSKLPYTVHFDVLTTRIDPPWRMEGIAKGELAGTGKWHLFQSDGPTAVVYEWDVQTTRWWMNAIAPFARWLFVRNHNWIMEAGEEGLRKRVNAAVRGSELPRD